jgi:hypothetical protein
VARDHGGEILGATLLFERRLAEALLELHDMVHR